MCYVSHPGVAGHVTPAHSPMCYVPHPSEGGVTGLSLLKHPQEPDVETGTYEHGYFKVQTDLVQLLLDSSAHLGQGELERRDGRKGG